MPARCVTGAACCDGWQPVVALDRLRQRRNVQTLEGLNLPSREDDPEQTAVGKELALSLRRAIGQLPEREAEVFCMRDFEDLSYQEIADALQMSSGAVGVALHKARAKLEVLLHVPVNGESP